MSADKLPKRILLIGRIAFDGFGVADRLADVAERGIHGVRQSMNGRRLIIAGDHQAGALVGLQILRDGRYFFVLSAGLPAHTKSGGQIPRPAFNLARWKHKVVIRHAGGGRRRRLYHVQPVHRCLAGGFSFGLHLRRQNHRSAIVRHILRGLIGAWRNGTFLIAFLPIFLGLRRVRHVALHPAFIRKLPRMTKIAGPAGEKIGVDRNHDVRLAEIVNRVHRTAERQHRALVGTVAAAHFILMPLGAGKLFQDRVDPGGERRRCHRLCKDAKAGAVDHRRFAPRRDSRLGTQARNR